MLATLDAARSVGAVLLVGNLLIVCHELGHYLAARWFGVHATQFAIGIGPTLCRRVDRRGTVWKLALLPVGGFVGFEGETQSPDTGYAARPPLVRMAVVAAGPAANVIVAVAMFATMLACYGQPAFAPNADAVIPGSAAERAGFQVGDVVLAIDGTAVTTFEDMRPALRSHPGQVVAFSLARPGGRVVELTARLGSVEDAGKTIGLLGIRSLTPVSRRLGPGEVAGGAVEKTWGVVADSVAGITRALTQGRGTENFAGVVGIAAVVSDVAGQGVQPFMALVAILSANLALMNLLPIPILDGGALLFCASELVIGRAISGRARDFGMRAGLALLASLFFVTTVHDLEQAGLFRWLALE